MPDSPDLVLPTTLILRSIPLNHWGKVNRLAYARFSLQQREVVYTKGLPIFLFVSRVALWSTLGQSALLLVKKSLARRYSNMLLELAYWIARKMMVQRRVFFLFLLRYAEELWARTQAGVFPWAACVFSPIVQTITLAWQFCTPL